jgi:CheY-like chemotaxis protein
MNQKNNVEKLINLKTNIVNINNNNMKKVLDLQNGRYVLFSISDTGIGMTNETKDKIFEPFFTTKPRDKGTGLGLATVYGIVKQNNGTVYVYSELNKGTTFKIYWPLSSSNIKDSDHKINTKKLIGGTEKLLIVEDDKSVLDFAESALTSIGYNIVTANSGEDAMIIAAKHNYDFALIISDVIMPGMSGPEFVQKIKQKNSKLKFLYVSGYTFDLIIKKGVIEKDINFISKPYNTIDLSLKIRNIIDN